MSDCERCDYDTHVCPGCGEPVRHGAGACAQCTDAGLMTDQDPRPPEECLFLESGTWVKPDGATWVRMEARGGDGGPSSNGAAGEPGGMTVLLVPAADVPAESIVHVGRGGRPQQVGHGWARVTTYFGSKP